MEPLLSNSEGFKIAVSICCLCISILVSSIIIPDKRFGLFYSVLAGLGSGAAMAALLLSILSLK